MDIEKNKIDRKLDSPPAAVGANYTRQNDIKAQRVAIISTADDEINVSEPSSPGHGEYLYNKAEQSISGHLREVDDTPGAERIMEMHKSGTFYEIHPDGTKVTRIYGDDFYICLQDHNLVVGGNLNITVQGDANILTKGNVKQKIGGDYDLTVHGNMTTRVRGDRVDYTKGNHTVQTFSNLEVRSEGTSTHYSKGNLTIQTKAVFETRSDQNTNFYSAKDLTLQAKEDVQMRAGDNFTLYSADRFNIQSAEKLILYAKDDLDMYSEAKISITAEEGFAAKTLNSYIYSDGTDFVIKSAGSFSVKSTSTMKLRSDSIVYVDGTTVRLNDPGPGITEPTVDPELPSDLNVTDKNISDKDPKDKDPSGGLTVEDSVIEPTLDQLFIHKTDNVELSNLADVQLTLPKDRVQID